jgi:hypothetical protein
MVHHQMAFKAFERVRPICTMAVIERGKMDQLQDTCRNFSTMWGGRANSIFEFDRTKHLDANGELSRSGRNEIEKFQDIFSPDFVICATAELSEIVPRKSSRFIPGGFSTNPSLWDLLPKMPIFKHLIQRDFSYVVANDDAPVSDVISLGGFPVSGEYAASLQRYRRIFEFTRVVVCRDNNRLGDLASLLSEGLKFSPNSKREALPDALLVDPNNTADLVSAWNCAALNPQILIKFLPSANKGGTGINLITLAELLKPKDSDERFIVESTVACEKANPELATVIAEFLSYTNGDRPPLFRTFTPITKRLGIEKTTCINLFADHTLTQTSSSYEFRRTTPSLPTRVDGDDAWASVITLTDFGERHSLPLAWPTGIIGTSFKSENQIFGGFNFANRRTREGIVTISNAAHENSHFRLPSQETIFKTLFSSHRISATASQAGKRTEAVLKMLGGVGQVEIIAVRKILEELDTMAKSDRKSLMVDIFENKITKAYAGNRGVDWRNLITHDIVEAGLEVRCPHCQFHSWFHVGSLGHTLQCVNCVEAYPFPSTSLKDNKVVRWAYRLKGPFAVEDYGRGSYSVALTLRFLVGHLDRGASTNASWASALDLKTESGKKLEVDFALLRENKSQLRGLHAPSELILGECKSFGGNCFQDKDFSRIVELAKLFPGQTVVLSALKNFTEFSEREKTQFAKLAKWCNEKADNNSGRRSNLVLLTGDELFGVLNPFSEYHTLDKAARDREITRYRYKGSMALLADIQQQKYGLNGA